MQQKRYTLVELLITIAIIAILAGILIPGTGYAMKRARITQARADISHLMTAIKSYETTYRLLPVETKTTANSGSRLTDAEYDLLVQILSKVNLDGKNGAKQGNLRNIKFLEVDQKFPQRGLIDPWGNRYIIIFNSAYLSDGIDHPAGGSHPKLRGGVFIYSRGPNGIKGPNENDSSSRGDDSGLNKANSNKSGADDICSWDTL